MSVLDSTPRTNVFDTEIVLGGTYKDRVSGFEGKAVTVYFHLYGCEQVALETTTHDGRDIKTWAFDSPRLVRLDEPGELEVVTPEARKTGGPPRDIPPRA